MRFIDLIKLGFRNLLRRKARTALTIIGVVIGTISIVVMISIGIGMNKNFEASVLENGSMTMIQVNANAWYEDEDGNYSETKQTLTKETVEQLKALEHVRCVTPSIYLWGASLWSGKYQNYNSIQVIDLDCYRDFGFPPLDDGTYPSKADGKNRIYVGSQVLSQEFGDYSSDRYKSKQIDWTRDKIELKFEQYQRNERKKEFSYTITNPGFITASESGYSETDWGIYMDIDLYEQLFRQYANTLKIDDRKKAIASLDSYENIIVNVDNMNNVTSVQEKIEELGFKSSSDMQYIAPMQETANMLELVLGAIGGVAMLVSAINIANTMIMSIYERTREIGIMKVLGCKVGDIKKLFLFEAGLIGFIGGLIGIGLSYAASALINTYGADLFDSLMSGGIGSTGAVIGYSVIPIWLPFFAAGFGIAVGLISGFFPALRATRISAIEAMKNE